MSKPKLSPSTFIGNQEEGVISFGSGQPDLPPPKEVYQILPHYRDFKYGQVQGMLKLREALAWQYPKSTAESFVVTNGASEALDLTLRVLARNGDQKPKFAKSFAQLDEPIVKALKDYAEQIRGGHYPSDEQCYHIKPGQLEKLVAMMTHLR